MSDPRTSRRIRSWLRQAPRRALEAAGRVLAAVDGADALLIAGTASLTWAGWNLHPSLGAAVFGGLALAGGLAGSRGSARGGSR